MSITDSKDICVIIPTYNEATVIKETITGLLPFNYAIVVVDDGSVDNTKEILGELPVFYLRHLLNLGQGAALQTGLCFATKKLNCKYFITFDADGQHCPEDIQPIAEYLIKQKLDIVFGSRFMGIKSNISLGRKLLLKIARWINYTSTGILLTDAHNGLRVLNKKAASSIVIKENRMAHATEILMETRRLKLQYAEYAIRINYTGYSKNKGQKSFDGITILRDIFLYKIFK